MRKEFIHPAKILFVHEGNQFDALFDLGFNITVRTPIVVNGLSLPMFRSPDPKEKALSRKAKECAMKLLLQKWCLVETFKESRRPSQWPANLFLPAQTKYRDAVVNIRGEDFIDVNKYLRILCDHGFDLDAVDVPRQA